MTRQEWLRHYRDFRCGPGGSLERFNTAAGTMMLLRQLEAQIVQGIREYQEEAHEFVCEQGSLDTVQGQRRESLAMQGVSSCEDGQAVDLPEDE